MVGVAFAVGAALAYAGSQVLTRQWVSDDASPVVGAFVALCSGTAGFALFAARSFATRGAHFGRGAKVFLGAGIFSSLGVLLLFLALERGEVVVVSPVISANPLFALLMAAVLLRGQERITLRIVAGTALVVTGVTVLTLS